MRIANRYVMEQIISTTYQCVVKLMDLVNGDRDTATQITNVLMDFCVEETIARKIFLTNIHGGAIMMIAAMVSWRNLERSSKRLISWLNHILQMKLIRRMVFLDPAYPSPISSCDGTGEWWEVLNCCRNNRRCNAGEGMCLRDHDCADGLRCGLQNCKRDFSTLASNWEHWMNCCYGIFFKSNFSLFSSL